MFNINNDILTLNWEGPYTLKNKELYNTKAKGVYLFTVKKDNEYHLYYVGKTVSQDGLSSRIIGKHGNGGHLTNYISGKYFLYDPKELKNKKMEIVYSPDKDITGEEFFNHLKKYQDIAKDLIESLTFFLCPFESDDIKLNDYIDIAESIIIHNIFLNKKDFPIIDNSKRVSSKIFGKEYKSTTLKNIFTENIIVNGLMQELKVL